MAGGLNELQRALDEEKCMQQLALEGFPSVVLITNHRTL